MDTSEGVATGQGGVAFTPGGTSLVYDIRYPNNGVGKLVEFCHTTTDPGDTGSTTTTTTGSIKRFATAVVAVVDRQHVTPPILWTYPEVLGLVTGTPAYRTGSTAVYLTHNDGHFLGTGGGGAYFTVLTVLSEHNGNDKSSDNGKNDKEKGDENNNNNDDNNDNEYSIEVNVGYTVTYTNI